MGEQTKTPLDVALIVANALDTYRNQHPLLAEELAEIERALSVSRMRLRFNTGETFVIDVTREPRPRANGDSL
jgi:hypothetical protein